ncbi:MAG: hypothetical protein MUP63_03825 [Candidatus Nanohaloarchaeota archaeon QJJ-7]|nr:hypothetical protein [Candidatus Nanohaloarchaeota archaeon QJJ-7]
MARERVSLKAEDEHKDDEPLVTPADEIKDNIDRPYLEDEGREEGSRSEVYDQAEKKAVQRLVAKLKEKGKSDAWIEDHMTEIRERAREELSG